MPVTVSTTASTLFKPCFAPSNNVGLCVKCNGDEEVEVIDTYGFKAPAYIRAPKFKPTCSDPATVAGGMNVGKWVCYVYVYACKRRYPFVEAESIGGMLYPRGNPSPASTPKQVGALGAIDVTIKTPDTTAATGRTDITHVWLFRTLDAESSADALVQANAGNFYYVDVRRIVPEIAAGTELVFHDASTTTSADLVDYDNLPAPQFQFCIYVDPYWWGFGNFQHAVPASWDNTGIVTFETGSYVWQDGRIGQACFLKSETSDGNSTAVNRTYYAYGIDGHTDQCQLAYDSDKDPITDLSAGTGFLVFSGPSTTLYRSKYRNPFAWGTTDYVGTVRVPYQFVFKVGGGTGSGLAQVPNMPLLVLSTKGPAATYTLDLRTAGTDQFPSSLRTISTLYSVTSHFSQFAAMQSSGEMMLFGFDADNFAIVGCNGNTVQAISEPWLTETMRHLSDNKDLLRMVHGLYDSQSKMNCLWVPSAGATDTMDLLLTQHSSTGHWHVQFEGDVLSSALVEGSFCSLRQLYLGTETGNFGQGMNALQTRNWLDEEATDISGVINVTSQFPSPIPSSQNAMVGNWMLLVDETGVGDQWGRIAAVASDGLSVTVDKVWSPTLGWTTGWFREPAQNDRFYIGLIETSFTRYFDLSTFVEDKKLDEVWLALEGVDPANPVQMQFFCDRYTLPLVVPGNTTLLDLTQIRFDDGQVSQQWKLKDPPPERRKVFGVRMLERGYKLFRYFGMGGKIGP